MGHLGIEMMINGVVEIVIQIVLGHHVGALKVVDGDVMIEEMIDLLHLIEKGIGEEIEVADGLMIVTVILNEAHGEGEKVKIVGDGRMIETTEVPSVEIEMGQYGEEEMIVVPEMTEALEVMVAALGVSTIVVHEVQGMIEVEGMTVVPPIGGLDLGNLIETINPIWEIVTAGMIDVTALMVVGTIGDQGLEEDQIEEDLEPVAHRRKTSLPAVILQQMERMENGKLSVNVNSLFYLRSSLINQLIINGLYEAYLFIHDKSNDFNIEITCFL